MPEPKKILFVCLGNIIRSPLAENLFRQHAEALQLSNKFIVDSAGTTDWHVGEPPDPRMRRTAASFGFSYDGQARHIRLSDLETFDLILAMDRSNYQDLMDLANSDQKRKIQLLRQFDPETTEDLDVPDPYYDGADGFVNTFRIVDRSVRGLLQSLDQKESE